MNVGEVVFEDRQVFPLVVAVDGTARVVKRIVRMGSVRRVLRGVIKASCGVLVEDDDMTAGERIDVCGGIVGGGGRVEALFDRFPQVSELDVVEHPGMVVRETPHSQEGQVESALPGVGVECDQSVVFCVELLEHDIVHSVQELKFVLAHVDANGESVSDCFQLFFVVFGTDCACLCIEKECRVSRGEPKPTDGDFIIPVESGRLEIPRYVVSVIGAVNHITVVVGFGLVTEGQYSGNCGQF